MEEYLLPLNEGPFPVERKVLRTYKSGEVRVDVGYLAREDFDYLGEWDSILGDNGNAIAYRAGIVEDYEDSHGNPVILLVLFGAPLRAEGVEVKEESAESYIGKLEKMLENKLLEMSGSADPRSIVGVIRAPPLYMTAELDELLKQR